MTTFFFSSKLALEVNTNEDGTLAITHTDGTPYQDAGCLIKSQGGIQAFLSHCIDKEEFDRRVNARAFSQSKEYRQIQAQRQAEKEAERKAKWISDYKALAAKGPIEATAENIGIVLRYFRAQDTAMLNYPAMSVGYSANMYDCDGKLAAAMILDHPIDVDGEKVSRFVSGAPVGHLSKYYRV